MKKLVRSESGYALVLTLIFLPLFIGVGLIVIDLGRAYNAQQDHQAAADALALAGAAELDGKSDSISRAKTAMTKITNTVSFLDATTNAVQSLSYVVDSTSPFTVAFLTNIPASDDTPIDASYVSSNTATTGAAARYVLVFSQSRNLRTLFFDPISRKQSDLPIGAMAVATLNRSSCDLTPMFMCNPFSNNFSPEASAKDKLVKAFAAGDLHGKMIKLATNPSGAPIAGNIGFLEAGGSKATPEIAKSLAGEPYDQCVRLTDTVDTKPGTSTPAWEGLNTRFDIREANGTFSSTSKYPAASNVRKGWSETTCTLPNSSFNRTDFTNFPRFSDNVPASGATNSFMNMGDWNMTSSVSVVVTTSGNGNGNGNGNSTTTYTFPPYWKTLYGSDPTTQMLKDMSSHPDANNTKPSRYDVYRYEIANSRLSTASVGGENGTPSCISTSNSTWPDRRTLLIAVVDCGNGLDTTKTGGSVTAVKNGAATVKVDAYAEVFLVNPVTGRLDTGSNTFDVEIIDLSERSTGEIDNFLREDTVLVR